MRHGSRRTKSTYHVVHDLHGNHIHRAGGTLDKLEVPDEFFTADGAVLKPGMELWFPYDGHWHHGTYKGTISENAIHSLWVVHMPMDRPPLRDVYSKHPGDVPVPPRLPIRQYPSDWPGIPRSQ